jgi:hypothetical protein
LKNLRGLYPQTSLKERVINQLCYCASNSSPDQLEVVLLNQVQPFQLSKNCQSILLSSSFQKLPCLNAISIVLLHETLVTNFEIEGAHCTGVWAARAKGQNDGKTGRINPGVCPSTCGYTYTEEELEKVDVKLKFPKQ